MQNSQAWQEKQYAQPHPSLSSPQMTHSPTGESDVATELSLNITANVHQQA